MRAGKMEKEMAFKTENVHISSINVGDVVMFEGKTKTVCCDDIRRDPFMGLTLFGDSYRLGYKPVKKVIIQRVVPDIDLAANLPPLLVKEK